MSKILLIDDMDSVRHAIATVLKKSGHEVVEVDDGHEGVCRCQSERFDLVITDIMMPGSDGTDVILELKGRTGSPPVVAMSGGGSGVPAESALAIAREKADVTLTKPFDNDDLLGIVNRLTSHAA